jgi:tetratricopeptide (TPR) repeat protein
MKSDSIAFGIAGIAFGLIAGWIIGTQQAASRPSAPAAQAASAPAAQANTRAAVLDEAKINALKSVAEREPTNAKPRVDLGNLYFDAERYDDAIMWYEAAVKLAPKDVNLSTDLGVCYYYTNQPDKALAQFDKSLAIDPKHAKTLLNVGVVRASKDDIAGATRAWEQVVALDPNSPEGQAAKHALDTLRAHGGDPKPGA